MGEVGSAAPAKSTSLFLQIVEHPDGTISRPTVPTVPPTGDHHPDSSSSVLSRDIPLNPTHKTFIRIYRPNLPSSQKLPILIFFHGGGFVVFSTASIFYHGFCEQMAAALPALVVSLDYRLAPEHRLPAAYEDAVEAVLWVRAQTQDPRAVGEPWLTNHGDFSRCFLMGSSSGANMAYHAGLRAVALELQPVKLVGLILNQPYFGGVERTPSESASEEDPVVPLRANDMMWGLALPKGVDRDHEFCNPVLAPPRPIRLRRCMVKGCQGDPLIDRQRAFVKMLEEEGVSVVPSLDEGGYHAIELFDPVRGQALFAELRDFISSSSPTTDAAASRITCE